MAESSIQRRVWMALSGVGARLFRNHVAGVAYQGQAERVAKPMAIWIQPGDVIVRQARPIKCGLCVGSSDLIGWRGIKIEPHHVGTTIAQFVAVEVKHKTGESAEQVTFRKAVIKAGGIAIVARSEGQAVEDYTRG